MKALFIITSAILVGPSKDIHQERFLQTLHTIDSIKSRFKNVEIWLCECSLNPLPEYMINFFKGVHIIEFGSDPRVIQIQKEVNHLFMDGPEYKLGQIKNRTEIHVLQLVLDMIDSKKYDRIFKISGRYFLSELFDVNNHVETKTFTLRNKMQSKTYLSFPNLIDSKFRRGCILWSFCPDILNQVKSLFLEIESWILKESNYNRIADIEHGLVKCLNEEKIRVINISKTGTVGRVDDKTIHRD